MDAHPVRNPANPSSPNLGPLSDIVRIDKLSLADKADHFRFETTARGTTQSFVQIDFDAKRGDLDLQLFRLVGSELVEITCRECYREMPPAFRSLASQWAFSTLRSSTMTRNQPELHPDDRSAGPLDSRLERRSSRV